MATAETKEPTMEEILASIRRIISEDGEGAPQPGQAAARDDEDSGGASDDSLDDFEAIMADDADSGSEIDDALNEPDVLELTEAVEAPADAQPDPADGLAELDEEFGFETEELADTLTEEATEKLVSENTFATTAHSLSTLSGLMMRGYPGAENTLEGMVREMLRPMLKAWLDANLPDMVERMVQREIARISGRAN